MTREHGVGFCSTHLEAELGVEGKRTRVGRNYLEQLRPVPTDIKTSKTRQEKGWGKRRTSNKTLTDADTNSGRAFSKETMFDR